MSSPSSPVLVVEDESFLRDFLIKNLEEAGFVVVSASNGLDAWDQLQQGLQPCLILLDLMTPLMDGRQFCTMKQADPALADIPVAILTAAQIPTETAQRLQVQHWLCKPFDMQQVIQIVQHYCTRPDLPRQPERPGSK